MPIRISHDPRGRFPFDRVAVPIALGWILASAIALRLTGIGFLLPTKVPPDGQVYAQEVELLRSGRSDFDRGHLAGLYPQLVPRLATLWPRSDDADGDPPTLSARLLRASAPITDLRTVIVLISSLTVLLTWDLARRFLDPTWALVASALIATSFLHVWFSQQERPHAPATPFYLLAMLTILDLRRNPSLRSFAFAGLGSGLAIGALHSGASVLPAFAAAVLLCGSQERPRASVGLRIAGVLLAASIVVVLFRCLYPFAFTTTGSGRVGPPTVNGTILRLTGHLIFLDQMNGKGTATVLWTAWAYEPVLVALLVLGTAAIAIRRATGMRARLPSASSAAEDEDRRRDRIVVLAHVLPYLGALLLYERTHQRFLIPLLPYAAVLGAGALREIVDVARARVPSIARRGAFAALVVAVPIGAQAFASVRLVTARTAADTYRLAADWIRANVSSGAGRIAMNPELDLPLLRSERSLASNARRMRQPLHPWIVQQYEMPSPVRGGETGYDLETIPLLDPAWQAEFYGDPASAARARGWRYVVLDVHEDWGARPFTRLREAVRRSGELVARFEPDPEGHDSSLPFEYQDDVYPRIHWLWRTLNVQRTGAAIEIYRM